MKGENQAREWSEPVFDGVLQRAQDGDAQAWHDLYRRYARPVLGAVRRRLSRRLRRRYDTMDLAQSVFVEVLRDLPRFENRGESAFRHWLYIKAENKVKAKLRRQLDRNGQPREKTAEHALDRPSGEASPALRAQAREDGRTVRALLEDLDPVSREVVSLRLEQGLSFGEIATRLGLASSDAARKRYARGLACVRDRWGMPGP